MTARLMPAALCALTVVLGPRPAAADDPPPLRVLFVGNSYTYGNDLPAVIAELAREGGQRPLEHDQETPGGCSFEKHVADGKAAAKIASRKWDWVVLQEQSGRPISAPDKTLEFGRTLAADAGRRGSKVLLYLTWARQTAPDTQDKLTATYRELARATGAAVAPAGVAWQAALAADPDRGLHGPDKSHPSRKGTYLTACVFYAVLYGKSPEGLPGAVAKLPDAEAKKLQAIAWRAVRDEERKE
jgi:hypothetical protein